MEFVMLKNYKRNKDIVKLYSAWCLSNDLCRHYIETIALGYAKKTGDLKEERRGFVIDATDYICIEPKLIYKNKKGYYTKVWGMKHYFNFEESKEIEEAITEIKKTIR